MCYFVVLVRCGVVVCALTPITEGIIVNELNASVYFMVPHCLRLTHHDPHNGSLEGSWLLAVTGIHL